MFFDLSLIDWIAFFWWSFVAHTLEALQFCLLNVGRVLAWFYNRVEAIKPFIISKFDAIEVRLRQNRKNF